MALRPAPAGSKLSASELKDFQDAFDLFDKDNNGTISSSELGNIMKSLGIKPSAGDVAAMLKEVDADGSHSISWSEFVTLLEKEMKSSKSKGDQMMESFKVFDVTGDGKISAKELKQVLSNMGEDVTDADIQALLTGSDVDGDGFVNYKEFVKSLGGC